MTRTLLLLTAVVALMMATAPGGMLGRSVPAPQASAHQASAPQASASPSRAAPAGA